MLKFPKNPIALDILKSCTDRHTTLDVVKSIIVNGIKLCAWCHEVKIKGPKYCGADCRNSARSFFYPQKEESLNFLMIKQNFQCAQCTYDWKPLVEQLLVNGRVYDKPNNYKINHSYWLMRRIKSKSPQERKPEVDHVIPIYKGGQSLGQENHQILCFSCHKLKSKSDLSGKRIKK